MDFKLHNGGGSLCCRGCSRQNKKLNTYDWLADIPSNADECDMVEVQFKNTRKGYYKNSNKIPLEKGDIVAVEATPGHDIGEVTLTGRLVPLQMRKANLKPDAEIRRVYRKAKTVDLEKYEEAKAKEHDTMIRSRQIAASLDLKMKIGDVEYQGDGNKAIFYYIADERVDFRQLIKVLAEVFRVRIEMKQIGARQEAGRIGGIGPCGRELCCATWMTSFISVSTSAARFQDISLNPQKLAGQCAKLKCCLNYEVDCYVEAQKRLPSREVVLETKDGEYYFFKADILSNQISYSTDKSFAANLVTISGKRAFEVISMNKKGIKPDTLEGEKNTAPKRPVDLLEQESLTRFDRDKRKKENNDKKGKKKKKGKENSQVDTASRPEKDLSRLEGNGSEVTEGQTDNREAGNNAEDAMKNKQRPQRNKRPNGDRPNKGEKPNRQENRQNNGEKSNRQENRQNNGEKPNRQENRQNNGEKPNRQENRQNNGEKPNRQENRQNNGEKPNRQENRQNNGEKPNRQENRQNNGEKTNRQENRQNNGEKTNRQENRQNNGEKTNRQENRQNNGEKTNRPTPQNENNPSKPIERGENNQKNAENA